MGQNETKREKDWGLRETPLWTSRGTKGCRQRQSNAGLSWERKSTSMRKNGGEDKSIRAKDARGTKDGKQVNKNQLQTCQGELGGKNVLRGGLNIFSTKR